MYGCCCVLTVYGHLYMFGSNEFGQLGRGDYKTRTGLNRVGGALTGKKVEKVACGDGFTVAATSGEYHHDGSLAQLMASLLHFVK